MKAPIICPVCGSHNFSDYLDTTDFAVTREKFSLKNCHKCGTLATSPQPDQNTINQYYQSDTYISHTNKSESSFLSLVYGLARKFSLKRKRKLIEAYSTGKSLLDLGCGTGHFLSEMKKAGWSVQGVEPADIARQQAEAKLKQMVFKSLHEAGGNSFSVITLWHVLEHLPHPDETLKQCYNLLEKKGLLVIAVPNYKSHDADYYKEYWAGFDVPRHLWHFNQDSMRMILERQGFSVKKNLPMKLDSYYVSLLSEQYKQPKKSTFAKYACAFKTGALSNHKAKKSGQYSSLIYLASKMTDETTNK